MRAVNTAYIKYVTQSWAVAVTYSNIGIKNGFECFIQELSTKGAVVQCTKAVGLSALTGALSWIIPV